MLKMSDPAEDCIYTTENLDEHLANCLENIESAGSFALFEGLKLVPNPGSKCRFNKLFVFNYHMG